jgi:hypothetical protein
MDWHLFTLLVIQAAVGAKALVGGVECEKDKYISNIRVNTEVFFKDIFRLSCLNLLW